MKISRYPFVTIAGIISTLNDLQDLSDRIKDNCSNVEHGSVHAITSAHISMIAFR